MYTTEEFENAVKQLNPAIDIKHIRKTSDGRFVATASGEIGSRRILWTADGHAFMFGKRYVVYDLKRAPYVHR
jgi:hypothetical protein